jgi:hypothetical protein
MEPRIQYAHTADEVSIVFYTIGPGRIIRRILWSPQHASLYHRDGSTSARPGASL